MKQRIFTATLLILAVITLLFATSSRVFNLFTGIILLISAWEWATIIGLKSIWLRISYLIGMGIAASIALISLPCLGLLWLPVANLWWLGILLSIVFYTRYSQWWVNHLFGRSISGFLVLIPCWVALCILRNLNYGKGGQEIILFLFTLIWTADASAYFIGKQWGKKKLAPHLSPGKTVLGAFAAIISSILIANVWFSNRGWAMLLCAVTVCFSIVGDLYESMIKRKVGIKDSGQWLPGHGGLLDRIDSLTAAAPIFIVLLAFMQATH